MTTTSESKVSLILSQPSDWTQWIFIVQDTAKTNEVWEYIDPSKKKDELPTLEPPKRPQGWGPNPYIQKKIDEMISSIPWVKRMVDRIQKDTEELEAKKDAESTIDFDSKSSPSTAPTSHAAMFSTS